MIEICIVLILVLVSVLFGYLVLGCNDCRSSRPIHHSRPVPDACSTGLRFEHSLVGVPH